MVRKVKSFYVTVSILTRVGMIPTSDTQTRLCSISTPSSSSSEFPLSLLSTSFTHHPQGMTPRPRVAHNSREQRPSLSLHSASYMTSVQASLIQTPFAALLSTWINTSSFSEPRVSRRIKAARWRPLLTLLTSSSFGAGNSVCAFQFSCTRHLC